MNPKTIPILDLKAQYANIKGEIHEAIERVLESQQFILGPEVEALEKSLADYCQSKYAFGVSSGTDALLVSLMAIGIQPEDEVITTPYSFFATAGSIVRLGARPIFVDIDPWTFNLDPNKLEKAITDRTRAILPVHMAGQVADMDPILVSAKRHNLFVIEDACQAIGADYHGMRAGSIGHIGCFSFFPSKNLGGYGDSGLVTTSDAALADKITLLRNHGQRPKYHNHIVGGNFRMDALQAAVLRVKFNHLEEWTEARRKHAAIYRRLLQDKGISIALDEYGVKPGLVLPVESGFGRHIYHLFMLKSRFRDDLIQHLGEQQIGCEVYYPIPLHLQECFHNLGYREGDFPHSEKAAKESLAIPIYPEMTETMIARVVNALDKFIKHRS